MIFKELADNAADAGGASLVVIDADTVVIADAGPGIAPEELASVFSTKRPLVSTKHWSTGAPTCWIAGVRCWRIGRGS